MRCRVAFETDAINDYFSRDIEPGEFSLYQILGESRAPVENYGMNLQNGIATLSMQLPGNCKVGDVLRFESTVSDSSRIESFTNVFVVQIKEATFPSGGRGSRRRPPKENSGDEREVPTGIQIPQWKRVYEADWQNHKPPFNQHTALRIVHAGSTGEDGESTNGHDIYDFYINVDNVHLKRYLKYEMRHNKDERIIQTRFEIGMVLIGLALLHHSEQDKQLNTQTRNEGNNEETNIEDQVAAMSEALAPFLLPMIDSLGALDIEDTVIDAAGEAT